MMVSQRTIGVEEGTSKNRFQILRLRMRLRVSPSLDRNLDSIDVASKGVTLLEDNPAPDLSVDAASDFIKLLLESIPACGSGSAI
mmetsp:Transcript_57397/g.151147  ORF Transcript_57397/g.151147 Transcript_57397/m.151147 type:complete len:85 (-) Transcript_57397:57-311(-)